MTMAICSTRAWGEGGSSYHTHAHTGSAAEGRQRHLFESGTGEREQHMCAGEGEESREGWRQRKQRAEKRGFSLTAFAFCLVMPGGVFACVKMSRETINRRWR